MHKISKLNRKFGFELEFSTPLAKLEKPIKKAISKIYSNKILVEKDYAFNNNYKKWNLKLDSSTGAELTTPISSMSNFPTIKKVLKALTIINPEITDSDSVHVHMQAKDVPKHNIIAAWVQIESTILKCFPKHRRNNTYCQKLIKDRKHKKISDFFISAEEESLAHHAILSLNYYSERGTVEFRVAEGNIDINVIKPWVMFCMYFLNYAKIVDPVKIICDKDDSKMNIDKMIDLLNIDNEEISCFLRERYERFK